MAKQVAPENVIGRDELIAEMWRAIDRGSAIFTAERRIGKTTVLRKMEAEPMDGKIVLYADLEKVDTPVRFVEVVLNDLKKYLTKRALAGNWLGDLVRSVGGTEIGGFIKIPENNKRNWQSVFEQALSDACKNQSNHQLVFLWDEIPYMLQKISAIEKKAGTAGNSALTIMDSLRALRHELPNVRMIFTGSVGLHHVLADIRGKQFASQSTNDMRKIEIGPLNSNYASILANHLLDYEKIQYDQTGDVIKKLVEWTDGVPFYLHRIITKLAMRTERITPSMVESEVEKHLTSELDPWEMEHFRDRLQIYYEGHLLGTNGEKIQFAVLAEMLLNDIAASSEARTINQCYKDVKAKLPFEGRSVVIDLLRSLSRDHYLKRDEKGAYRFRFPLIQKWWILAEGLN